MSVAMTSIEGVRLIALKKVVNERGHLLEVQRSDDDHFPGFAQAYVTCTLPGIVKAWYRHRKQLDQIALVHGTVTIALYDARVSSPSHRQVIEWVLTDETPALVQIPPGIWHGFKASGDTAVYLLHLNSTLHDPVNTDEERLPPHTADIPYSWR